MAIPAPKSKEVQEFKFSLATRLRVFPSNWALDRSHPVKSVASCSKYGLVFACEPNGVQCVQTDKLIVIQDDRGKSNTTLENYPRRLLSLPARPTHVDVSSDGESLAVSLVTDCALLQIYNVKSFAAEPIVRKTGEVRLSSSPGVKVTDLQWNPSMAGVIGVVLSDGSVVVVEFKETGGPTISSAPPSTQASSICWSPKGKQAVIGSWSGSLTQFKPDLKAVKTFPAPVKANQKGPLKIVGVYWLSTYQFIASYVDTGDPLAKAEVHVVDVPKTGGNQSFVNFDDIFFCSDASRPEYFFSYLAFWNLMVLSTGNASEAAVLVQENETWVQWVQDGSCRAELPLRDNHEDAFTIGMTVDISSKRPIPIAENQTIPPMPILFLMSHDGVLSLFHAVNLFPGAPNICTPAQTLPEQYFTHAASSTAGDNALKSPNLVNSLTGGPTPSTFPSMPQFGTTPFSSSPASLPATAPAPAASATSQPFQLPQSSLFHQLGATQPTTAPQPSPQLPQIQQQSPHHVEESLPIERNQQRTLSTFAPTESEQLASINHKPIGNATPAPAPTRPLVQTPQAASVSLPKSDKLPQQYPSSPPPSKVEKKPEPKPVDEAVYWKAVNEELSTVQKIINASKAKKFDFDINEEDLVKKTVAVDNLESFEKDLRETTSAQMSEVAALRTTLIEMCGWIENAKAKRRQTNSQRYFEVVESQELDPVIKKIMKSINEAAYYLENQISATSAQLDAIWAKQSPGSSSEKFDVPELEKIYETIKLLLKVAEEEKVKVEKLQARMAVVRRRVPSLVTEYRRGSTGQEALERLADKLLATKVSDSSLSETATRYILLANAKRELAPEKLASLQEWHKRRSFVIQTKAVRPIVPQNDLLQSLRMTSPLSPPAERNNPTEPSPASITPIPAGLSTPIAIPTSSKPSVVKTLFASTPLVTKPSSEATLPVLEKAIETPVAAKPAATHVVSTASKAPPEKPPTVGVVSSSVSVTPSSTKPAFSFTTQAASAFSFTDPNGPGLTQKTATSTAASAPTTKSTFQFAIPSQTPFPSGNTVVTSSVKTTSLFSSTPGLSYAQAKSAHSFSTTQTPSWSFTSTPPSTTAPSIFSGKPVTTTTTTSSFNLPATTTTASLPSSIISPPKSLAQENQPLVPPLTTSQLFSSSFQPGFCASATPFCSGSLVGTTTSSIFGGGMLSTTAKPSVAETSVSASSFNVPPFSTLGVSSTSTPSNFTTTVTSQSVEASTPANPALSFVLTSTTTAQQPLTLSTPSLTVTPLSVPSITPLTVPSITPLTVPSVPAITLAPTSTTLSSFAIPSNPLPAGSLPSSTSNTPALTASIAPSTTLGTSLATTTLAGTVNFGSVALSAFSAAPVFGAPPVSTAVTTVSQSQSPASSTPSIFGQSTGYADSTSQIKPATSIDTPLFSSVPPAVASVTSSTPAFGAVTSAPSAPTSSGSIFGVTSALSNSSFFGSPNPTATTSASSATPAVSIFGGASSQQPATTSSAAPIFGSGSFTAPTTTGGSSFFRQPLTSPNASTPTTAASQQPTGNVFGGFGSVAQKPAANVFGGAPVFGQTTPFGQPAPSAGTFGSSGGSLFGSSSFGSPTSPQANLFSNAGGNMFGGGAFTSGSNPPVAQTGFGAFQPPPSASPFGSPSGGAVFGGQPTFGSSPSFGSSSPLFGGQDKVFGSSQPASPFGATTTGSPTFDKLASQNMDSFGNLAQQGAQQQQQQPTFGASAFGSPQQSKPQQAFSNTPTFGGSSFNTWR